MTQINLLPWREEARRKKQMRFGLAILGTFIIGLIFVVFIHFHYNSLINNQTARNDFLQQELGKEQVVLTDLNKIKKQQKQIGDQLHFIFSLRLVSYEATQLLDNLARVVPDGITFTKIAREGKIITIIGKAKSNQEITLLMKNIANVKMFKEPDLTDITAKETTQGEERAFQLKVEQI